MTKNSPLISLLLGAALGVAGTLSFRCLESPNKPQSQSFRPPISEAIKDTEFTETVLDQLEQSLDKETLSRITFFKHSPYDVGGIELNGRNYALAKIPDENAQNNTRIAILAKERDGDFVDLLRCGSFSLELRLAVNNMVGGKFSDSTRSYGDLGFIGKPYFVSKDEVRHLTKKLDEMKITEITTSGASLYTASQPEFYFVDSEGKTIPK